MKTSTLTNEERDTLWEQVDRIGYPTLNCDTGFHFEDDDAFCDFTSDVLSGWPNTSFDAALEALQESFLVNR